MKLRQTICGVALAVMVSGSGADHIPPEERYQDKETCDVMMILVEYVMLARQGEISKEQLMTVAQQNYDEVLWGAIESIADDAYTIAINPTQETRIEAVREFVVHYRKEFCSPELQDGEFFFLDKG